MLNRITIMGRMTRDPELRHTPQGTPVVTFTLAVDRDYQSAEFVSKYFTKGSMTIATGRLQMRDWEDKNDNKRRSAEVIADSVYFGESKRSTGTNAEPPEFEELEADGETLPF